VSRAVRRLLAAAVLGAPFVVLAPAWAAEPTEAQLEVARERFRDGLALEEAGDFAAARATFDEVRATKITPQVLYHLAYCDEQLGALVAAIDGYGEAIELAERVGESAAAVVEEAQPRLAALERRVPRLRVRVEGDLAPGDAVTIDGAPVERWSEDVRVDPGRRRVAVVRDGAPLAEVTVEARPGERATARLTLPAREPPAVAPPSRPPPPVQPPGEGPPAAALVVGGVGLASAAIGGVTLALQQVAIDDVRSTCADPGAGTGCDPRARAREDDARVLGVTSGVLLGVGAACVVTGIVLWVALDDEPAGPATARRGVALAPGPLGVTAAGRF
jgi:hypothetical protein